MTFQFTGEKTTELISTDVNLQTKTLIGFVLARRKLYILAKDALDDALTAIESFYGYTSWEYGIAIAEFVKCCNMSQSERTGERWARRALTKRQGLEDRADTQYLQVALADSLLVRSEYGGAIEILNDIATKSNDPSISLKAIIRLSKAHRRVGEIFPAPKIITELTRGLQVLNNMDEELRSAFMEELECNVSRVGPDIAPIYQETQQIVKEIASLTRSSGMVKHHTEIQARDHQVKILLGKLEAIEALQDSEQMKEHAPPIELFTQSSSHNDIAPLTVESSCLDASSDRHAAEAVASSSTSREKRKLLSPIVPERPKYQQLANEEDAWDAKNILSFGMTICPLVTFLFISLTLIR
jgi:hypothetical protein